MHDFISPVKCQQKQFNGTAHHFKCRGDWVDGTLPAQLKLSMSSGSFKLLNTTGAGIYGPCKCGAGTCRFYVSRFRPVNVGKVSVQLNYFDMERDKAYTNCFIHIQKKVRLQRKLWTLVLTVYVMPLCSRMVLILIETERDWDEYKPPLLLSLLAVGIEWSILFAPKFYFSVLLSARLPFEEIHDMSLTRSISRYTELFNFEEGPYQPSPNAYLVEQGGQSEFKGTVYRFLQFFVSCFQRTPVLWKQQRR